MASNTVYSLNSFADKIAQLCNIGNPPNINVSPTYAAAVALAGTIVQSGYVRMLGVNATSATCTITTASIGLVGSLLAVSCEATGGTCTYTFSTGFKVSATAAATTGTAMTVMFRSNGTNWIEVGRSLAITI